MPCLLLQQEGTMVMPVMPGVQDSILDILLFATPLLVDLDPSHRLLRRPGGMRVSETVQQH